MKGDFTRLTFNPEKHYRAVLMQQGRVQLDADWNEQVQIAEHRYSTFFSDFVGQSGTPYNNGMRLEQDANPALQLSEQTYIRISELPSLTSMTVELWFCFQPLSGVRCLLDLSKQLGVALQDDNLCIREGAATTYAQVKKVEVNVWQHLAVVIKRSGFGTGYRENTAVILNGSEEIWKHEIMRSEPGTTIAGGLTEMPPAPATAGTAGSPAFGDTLPSVPTITIPGELPGETKPPPLGIAELLVGAQATGSEYTNYYGGMVAELRIWDQAKEIADIEKLRSMHLAGNEPGLLRYYRFDESDTPTKAVDTSTNKKNADIVNTVTRYPGPFQIGAISLSAGRYYVDGLLVESEQSTPLPTVNSNGAHLAYLDVWTRHISAAEDKELLEPALGGADTTTRLKTVWQLRCVPLDKGRTIEELSRRYRRGWPSPQADWERTLSSGRMTVDTAGINGNDNRLYRVEIHQSGRLGQATFKWSRDNGAVVARVDRLDNNKLILANPDLTTSEAFRGAQWIEVTNNARTEDGRLGVMVKLQKSFVEDGVLSVATWDGNTQPPDDIANSGEGVTVRRWDGATTVIQEDNFIALEPGLRVKFSTGDAYYRSGDYWLIPVRSGVIYDWVRDTAQSPQGIEHHYAALGLIIKDDTVIKLLDNLQSKFQPLNAGNVSKLGDVIDGNLCVREKVSIGPPTYHAPLTITDVNDALISFADQEGKETWRISQVVAKDKQPARLSVTDADGKGVFLSSGNLGIGTLTPQSLLHLNAPVSATHIGAMTIDVQSFGNIDNARASHFLQVRDIGAALPDGATHFIIRGDGNVGIGATDPGAKLEINLANPAGWGGNQTGIRLKSPDNQYYLDIKSDVIESGNVGYQISPIGPGSAYKGLTIDTFGNVGIGTPAPSEKLVIQSDPTEENVSLLFRTQDRPGDNGGEFYPAIKLTAGWHDTSSSAWGEQRLSIVGASSRDGWTEIMTLKANGDVGIGRNDPLSKLEVMGHIAAVANTERNSFTQLWGDGAIIAHNEKPLRFGHASDLKAENWREKMRITPEGKVGIGTEDPKTKLDIRDTDCLVQVRPSIPILVKGTDHGGALYFGVDSEDQHRATAGIETSWGGKYKPQIAIGVTRQFGEAGISPANLLMDCDGNTYIRQGTTSRIHIQGVTGNVGIGTTEPKGTLQLRRDPDNSPASLIIEDTFYAMRSLWRVGEEDATFNRRLDEIKNLLNEKEGVLCLGGVMRDILYVFWNSGGKTYGCSLTGNSIDQMKRK